MIRKIVINALLLFLTVSYSNAQENRDSLNCILFIKNLNYTKYRLILDENQFQLKDSLKIQLIFTQEFILTNGKREFRFEFKPTIQECQTYKIFISKISRNVLQCDIKMCDGSTQRQTSCLGKTKNRSASQ